MPQSQGDWGIFLPIRLSFIFTIEFSHATLDEIQSKVTDVV